MATLFNSASPTRPRSRRRDPFALWMLLVMYGILAAGFGYKAVMRNFDYYTGAMVYPRVLYWHGWAFTLWLVIYAVQVALIFSKKLIWHRQLGIASLAVCVTMPPLGVMAGIAMRHFDIYNHMQHDRSDSAFTFLAVLVWDMILFTALASAGYLTRKRPDWHRRLMFLATLSMVHAGIARIALPHFIWPGVLFYLPDHAIIAAAAWHDRQTIGRVHRAFRIVWPIWAAGQTLAMYLWLGHPVWFVNLCKVVVNAWPG